MKRRTEAAEKRHANGNTCSAVVLGFVSNVVPTPPSASVDVRNAGEGTGTSFAADTF